MVAFLLVTLLLGSSMGTITNWAHRGASGVAPENTMIAFKLALEEDADFECDVQVTEDSKLILLHDSTVDRTTNGRGNVASLTWEYISTLDAGSWKAPEYAGEPVPLVADALDLIDKKSKMNDRRYRITLDMKSTARGMVPLLKDLLDNYDEQLLDQVELGCWDNTCIDECLQYLPGVKKVLIAAFPPNTNTFPDYEERGLTGFSISLVLGIIGLTPAFAEAAANDDFDCYTWTHNSMSDIARVAGWYGVNGIVGDYPDRINEVIRGHVEFNSTMTDETKKIGAAFEVMHGCHTWRTYGTILTDKPSKYETFFSKSSACEAARDCPLADIMKPNASKECQSLAAALLEEAIASGIAAL